MKRRPKVPPVPVGHCIYCGRRTRALACAAHRDLVRIEMVARV